MTYESYAVAEAREDLSLFEFTSVGPRGNIKKVVAFLPTADPRVFNLAFGDMYSDDSMPDDIVVTNNGDRNRVLATVAEIVDRYTKRYPTRWVYFRGSTKERTRLYRIAITLNQEALTAKYEILGAFHGRPAQPFAIGTPVDFFLIKRKNN